VTVATFGPPAGSGVIAVARNLRLKTTNGEVVIDDGDVIAWRTDEQFVRVLTSTSALRAAGRRAQRAQVVAADREALLRTWARFGRVCHRRDRLLVASHC
jgi:hypothetical protein